MDRKQQRIEARKAAKDVRNYVARAMAFADAGLDSAAYRAAESAQAAAFDLKAIIGGDLAKYDAAANAPGEGA